VHGGDDHGGVLDVHRRRRVVVGTVLDLEGSLEDLGEELPDLTVVRRGAVEQDRRHGGLPPRQVLAGLRIGRGTRVGGLLGLAGLRRLAHAARLTPPQWVKKSVTRRSNLSFCSIIAQCPQRENECRSALGSWRNAKWACSYGSMRSSRPQMSRVSCRICEARAYSGVAAVSGLGIDAKMAYIRSTAPGAVAASVRARISSSETTFLLPTIVSTHAAIFSSVGSPRNSNSRREPSLGSGANNGAARPPGPMSAILRTRSG